MSEIHQSTLDDTLQTEIQELKDKVAEFCQIVSLKLFSSK